MKFKNFIFSKLALIAIIFALIYQFIMTIVYIPGYESFDDHLDQLRVAVIKSDDQRDFQNDSVKKLKQGNNSPHVVTLTSKKAQKQVKNKKIVMAIKLPENVANNIRNNRAMHIKYYINPSSNQTISKVVSVIESKSENSLNQTLTQKQNVANVVTANVKANGTKEIEATVKASITKNPALMESPDKVAEIKSAATKKVVKIATANANSQIKQSVVSSSEVKLPSSTLKFSENLGAMFLSLGCFISVMTASMLLLAEFKVAIRKQTSKWKAFLFYELTFIVISIVSPIISILTFKIITGITTNQALLLLGQHMLLTLISSQIVSIPAFLFGQAALMINLPLALVQTIISGAIMPVNLLPDVYQFLANILPLPANYDIDIDILTKVDTSITNNEITLGLILLITFIILILVMAVRKFKKEAEENIEINSIG